MDIVCPGCGALAEPAGHEDGRAFFQCATCGRAWAAHIGAPAAEPAVRLEAARAPRVLVADDSPEMLGLLAAWLEDEGCIVIAVGSGREAIDAWAAQRPDVAFLDVILPPPDGFQVCEVMSRQAGPAVVLMTGMSNPDLGKVAEAGAVMLLRKPFARQVVVDALAEAIAHLRTPATRVGA